MTCDRYRPLLALLVGNDLDPREAVEVRQHISGCASCQSQWKSLEAAGKALQAVSHQAVIPAGGSLWPELSKRVGGRAAVAREAAPGWLTLGAFSAACAAVLWLTVSTPVFDFDFREAQLAESDGGGGLDLEQSVAPRGFADQLPPQLQLVNDTQPAIPFEFGPSNELLVPQQGPSRNLGGPRSF